MSVVEVELVRKPREITHWTVGSPGSNPEIQNVHFQSKTFSGEKPVRKLTQLDTQQSFARISAKISFPFVTTKKTFIHSLSPSPRIQIRFKSLNFHSYQTPKFPFHLQLLRFDLKVHQQTLFPASWKILWLCSWKTFSLLLLLIFPCFRFIYINILMCAREAEARWDEEKKFFFVWHQKKKSAKRARYKNRKRNKWKNISR